MAFEARAHLLSNAAAGIPLRCKANLTARWAALYSTTAASSSTTNAATPCLMGAFIGSILSSSSTTDPSTVGLLPKAAPSHPAAPNNATCGLLRDLRMSSRNLTRSAGGVACNARNSNAPCFGDTSSALSKNWSCAKAVESLSRSGLGRAFVASNTNPTPGARGSSNLVVPSVGVAPVPRTNNPQSRASW